MIYLIHRDKWTYKRFFTYVERFSDQYMNKNLSIKYKLPVHENEIPLNNLT